jgi:hypothetical protein
MYELYTSLVGIACEGDETGYYTVCGNHDPTRKGVGQPIRKLQDYWKSFRMRE